LKEGSFWIQGKKSLLTQKLFFNKHLKECVAIAYFQLPVNRKQEKRREFFRMYLHYGASYAPETCGILKEESFWIQGTKIQPL
jgi:hypothetical protein